MFRQITLSIRGEPYLFNSRSKSLHIGAERVPPLCVPRHGERSPMTRLAQAGQQNVWSPISFRLSAQSKGAAAAVIRDSFGKWASRGRTSAPFVAITDRLRVCNATCRWDGSATWASKPYTEKVMSGAWLP